MDIFNPYNSATGLNQGLNCPLEYLQVQTTALVSLLFIAMISIDCKITKFSLHLFVYFLGDNYNIGKLTSTTSKERMTMNFIFAGATPIN